MDVGLDETYHRRQICLCLLCGLPAAGKTTLVHALSNFTTVKGWKTLSLFYDELMPQEAFDEVYVENDSQSLKMVTLFLSANKLSAQCKRTAVKGNKLLAIVHCAPPHMHGHCSNVKCNLITQTAWVGGSKVVIISFVCAGKTKKTNCGQTFWFIC